jgi:site-specific DNA recombinase
MRRGRLQKYQAGSLLPWTRAPYGYRVDPARPRDPAGVRLGPVEAAIVAELFVTYLQDGQSLIGVTKHLMALEIPTPRGHRRWNQSTVRGILANPVYLGTVYIGLTRPTPAHQRHSPLAPLGRVRRGHTRTDPQEWTAVAQVPAVVSQEHFDLVQAKLAHNQQFASRNNRTHPYLLRALVSCGVCHLACTGPGARTPDMAMPTTRVVARVMPLFPAAMKNVAPALSQRSNSMRWCGKMCVKCSHILT